MQIALIALNINKNFPGVSNYGTKYPAIIIIGGGFPHQVSKLLPCLGTIQASWNVTKYNHVCNII